MRNFICQECGMVLVAKVASNGEIVGVCPRCGYDEEEDKQEDEEEQ